MKRIVHNLGTILGIILFILALRVLTEELKGNNYHEIMVQVRHLPFRGVLLALVL